MNWHDLLLVAGGYGAGVGSCVFAVWLGDRLRKAAEEQTRPVRPGPIQRHVGADGSLHLGHVASCRTCHPVQARRTS